MQFLKSMAERVSTHEGPESALPALIEASEYQPLDLDNNDIIFR